MSFDEAKVVFDIGSQNAKAGFAGESFPRCVMKTVVGRFRHQGFVDGVKMIYVGDEAVKNRGILNLNCPMKDGRIIDWDDMEMLWHNLFYTQLQVPPEGTNVVHSVHPLATVKEKHPNLNYPVKDGRIIDWDDMKMLWHNLFYTQLQVPPEGTNVVHSVHPLATVKEKHPNLNYPVKDGRIIDWNDMEMLWHNLFYTQLQVPPEGTNVVHSVHPLATVKEKHPNLNYPMKDGRIIDWDDMEMLWHNLFYTQLQVPPEGTNVVHSVHPLATVKEKHPNLNYPVKDGRIIDWDDMEMLWHNLFYTQLQVPPEGTNVVHSVHPLATVKEKQKITQILFEVFAIKGLIIAKSPILSLYANGRTTGLIYGSGHSCSYVCPVFEGFPLQHATIMTELSGAALTEYMSTLLTQVGYQLTTPFERDIVEKIKKSMCYVSHDYPSEYETLLNKEKVQYQLPDGQFINLGTEQIQCPEMFFQPEIAGKTCPNVPDIIHKSIEKCDVDYRPMLFNNIFLSGGSTMFPGLSERLRAELQAKVKNQPGYNTKVVGIPNRSLSVWAGGSMIACMDTVKAFWLTSKEYEDSGDETVVYKFF